MRLALSRNDLFDPGFRHKSLSLFLLPTLASFVVLARTGAANAGQSARLVYARTADAVTCGEEPVLRRAVARRLGYDPFVGVSDNIVVAELRGEANGLSARVLVVEKGKIVGGTRELVSNTQDCEELLLAVALAISIAIDPDSIERVADADPEPSPKSEPLRPAAETASQPMPPLLKTRLGLQGTVTTKLTWRVGLGASLATGPLPKPTVGVAGALEMAGRHWSLGLEPRWFAPSKTEPQSTTQAQASASWLGGTVAPCLHQRGWQGCYLLELGRLTSHGLVSRPNRDVALWAAQGLRLAYHWGGNVGLGATVKADGLAAFNRVAMSLNGAPAYETPWVVARLGIEANYSF